MNAGERRAHCQQIGHLGGAATVARYGPEYMRTIGARGFATTCARYYDGHRAHALRALERMGRRITGRNRRPAFTAY